MSNWLLGAMGVGLVAAVLFAVPRAARTEEAASEKMLAHDVFFKLKDGSDAARQKLVEACKTYLSKHSGTVFFAAGTVAADFNREVNDRDFDVALHIYFENKAAHDKYQESERHLKFIAENRDNWTKVRVFDSYVEK